MPLATWCVGIHNCRHTVAVSKSHTAIRFCHFHRHSNNKNALCSTFDGYLQFPSRVNKLHTCFLVNFVPRDASSVIFRLHPRLKTGGLNELRLVQSTSSSYTGACTDAYGIQRCLALAKKAPLCCLTQITASTSTSRNGPGVK